MKKVYLLVTAIIFILGSVNAQNLNSSNGGYETKRIINKKKFRVLYEEVVIDKSVEEVWNEVAGNFMNIDEIVTGINYTRCLSGDTTTGLDAARLCNLDFQGKTIEIKERIIDFKECGDHRELTYDVYESNGAPVKTYGTWVVKKGTDGKTYLGSVFIVRPNFGLLTGLVAKKLKKSGLRTGVLAYKHYLETGEKKVDPKKLSELYP
ncbi:MAG: hypothetical protein AB8F94_01260 [Saprospiraceae bacterium]